MMSPDFSDHRRLQGWCGGCLKLGGESPARPDATSRVRDSDHDPSANADRGDR
jgi:hypothetical protein